MHLCLRLALPALLITLLTGCGRLGLGGSGAKLPGMLKKQAAGNQRGEATSSGGESLLPLGTGTKLRYRWNNGNALSYEFKYEFDTGERTDNLSGFCTYTARRTRNDSYQPGDNEERKGTGTAFAVHPDGYLVTCAHVVDETLAISVALGGKSYPAKVLSVDRGNDLALLKIEARGMPVVALADSDGVEVGLEVRAIGFPLSSVLGDSIKATRGTVSGIENRKGRKAFQIDANINPGNSGGPLVNEMGEVLGVNNAQLAGPAISNVGFSVPINYAKQLLQQQGVKHTTDRSPMRLEGTALVKRVSPAVALVTVTLDRSAERDAFALTYFGVLRSEERRPQGNAKPATTVQIGGPPGLPGTTEIHTDAWGKILKVLNRPGRKREHGLVLGLIEPLSPDGDPSWQTVGELQLTGGEEAESETGPGLPFGPRFGPPFGPNGFGPFGRGGLGGGVPIGPSGPGGGPFGPRGFGPGGFGPRVGSPFGPGGGMIPRPPILPGAGSQSQSTETVKLRLRMETLYTLEETEGDIVKIRKVMKVRSAEVVGGRPVLQLDGEGQITFDQAAGAPRDLHFKATLLGRDGTTTHRATLTESFRQAEKAEVPQPPEIAKTSPPKDATPPAQAPAPAKREPARPPATAEPAPPKLLTDEEFARILAGLKSPDPRQRQRAADSLARAKPDDKRPEVVKILLGMFDESNGWPRNAAIAAIGYWGTKEHGAALMKMLDHQEVWTRWTAMEALGRLQYEPAAPVLAERLTVRQDRGRASAGLKLLGAAAEKPVLQHLDHQSFFVRREAFGILKEIGTSESVPKLQALAANKSDLQGSRMAEDVLKAILERQKQ